MASVRFDFWNGLAESEAETFLQAEEPNPSRSLLAVEVLRYFACRWETRTLAEVGPATGLDYARFYRRCFNLRYAGFEGSEKMARIFRAKHPEADLTIGGFERLGERTYDVVVSRAVIEHQPTLQPSLSQQVAAARELVGVCWFIPPGDTEEIAIHPTEGLHYNRYRKDEVVDAFKGWHLEITEGRNRRKAKNGSDIYEDYAVYVARR